MIVQRDRQAAAGWQTDLARWRGAGGTDIVSFNLYRLAGPGPMLKRCEMSSAKVVEFVLGFEPESCDSIITAEK